MGDLWYLALAYGVIWTGLLGYVFRLSRQAAGLREELDLLRQMLGADEMPGAEAEGETAAAVAAGQTTVPMA